MEFVFEQVPWEAAMNALQPGDSISGAYCLSLLEAMPEEDAEAALLLLEERQIALDISSLPVEPATGEAALRLQLERKLAAKGTLMEELGENDPLRLYLEELADISVDADAETLVKQYLAGDDTAAQQLVNLSLPVVVQRACAMTGHGVLLSDLLQEGSLGLWQGVLNYTSGDFAEHARWWIDQYLSKAVLLQAYNRGIGQRIRQGMSDYRDADQSLLSELGRNPTVEEIAEAIHVSVEEARTFGAILSQARVRQQTQQRMQPREETPDDEQAVENTAYFQTRQRILEMLSTLSQQEAQLLTLRFGLEGGLPRTPEQIGELMGLAVDEVVKIEADALLKLRQQAQ